MKNILIVGEYLCSDTDRTGELISGSDLYILKSVMAQAGISWDQCRYTNVINQRPPGGQFLQFTGPKRTAIPDYRPLLKALYIQDRYAPEITRLFHEIEEYKPHVIIALGNIALWALCKKSGIANYRGSPIMTHDNQYKVIPTWQPNAIQRQWELRPIMLADLQKARLQSAFPELRRPEREIWMRPTLSDIELFIQDYLLPSPYISCDIETKSGTITEVGYSNAAGTYAIVIPFWERGQKDGNYWRTAEEERAAWTYIRIINRDFLTIGQNFQYDMQYCWRAMGIPTPRFHGDTMILHHSLQPEMKKGLGFLASIYTDEPSWKFMRTADTLKQGDDQ